MCGINSLTEDPTPGGEIVRGASGQPTGLLKDEAMRLASELIPAPTDKHKREAVLYAAQLLLSHGVTMVLDMGYAPLDAAGSRIDLQHVLEPLAEEGKLPLRVQAFLPLPACYRGLRATELAEQLAGAHPSGLQVALHAIGDRALQGLRSWARMRRPTRRTCPWTARWL
ncbi:hypothetical protein WJX81_001543 [Elliptochloris bilobata]|uniref:Amidohydrolase 3 domain-containing protein n=1 Tax=Elliptochloris bilobata TaxID=381761 RepID=A0AAW1RQW7_9CHLO